MVWEMQGWRSKARVRSAVLKEIKDAVSLVLWHLLCAMSGKELKDEVRIKGYSLPHVPLYSSGLWIS